MGFPSWRTCYGFMARWAACGTWAATPSACCRPSWSPRRAYPTPRPG
ncbi:hypothetical protein ACFWD7_55830 [Streptomyces mirabilis]